MIDKVTEEREAFIEKAILRHRDDAPCDLYSNLYLLYTQAFEAGQRNIRQRVLHAMADFPTGR